MLNSISSRRPKTFDTDPTLEAPEIMPLEHQSDPDLVQRLVAGNHDAMSVIQRRNRRWRRRLLNPAAFR